jgi:hypothetical protein
MIPAPEVKPVCPKCGLALNFFGNTSYCPNDGQLGTGHRGDRCPNGCAGPVVNIAGAGKRCQACGSQW